MTAIKAYTDLEQSKKLAEFLPLESADKYWIKGDTETPKIYPKDMMKDSVSVNVPCWSLAALLGVIPNPSLHKTFYGWRCDSYNWDGTMCQKCLLGDTADNPIDACVNMIEKLHKNNLL